jgi:microcystin-dependent protein
MYGGAAAPTGWLLCDGTSTTGYAALAAIVGATTPDFKGRFPIGDNATLTLLGTGGSLKVLEANLPSHTHVQDAHNHTQNAHTHGGTTGDQSNDHNHTQVVESTSSTGDVHTHGTTGTAGNPDGTNTTGSDITANQNNGHSHTFTTAEATATNIAATATNQPTGGGTDYYPPYLVVNYIIKHD